MASYIPKPPWPRGVCAPIPGLKVFWPIVERARGLRNVAVPGVENTQFTGTPTYSTGPLGAQVGGFSTANYFAVDRTASTGFLGSPPLWFAVACAQPTGTPALGYALSADDATGASRQSLGVGAAGDGYQAQFVYLSNIGGLVTLSGGPALNDGRPHVLVARSLAVGSHELWVDGLRVATATTLLQAGAYQLSLGLTRSGGVAASPFAGTIQGAMVGQGALPDPAALARDFFATIRGRSVSRAVLAAAGSAAARAIGLPIDDALPLCFEG